MVMKMLLVAMTTATTATAFSVVVERSKGAAKRYTKEMLTQRSGRDLENRYVLLLALLLLMLSLLLLRQMQYVQALF